MRPHSERRATNGIVSSRIPSMSRVIADELLVSFRVGDRVAVEDRLRAVPGVQVVGALMDLPVELVHVAAHDRSRAIAAMRSVPGVQSVQPDRIEAPESVPCAPILACALPDDPGFGYQWYLYNQPSTLQPPGGVPPSYGADVNAPLAWRRTRGSSAVTIAVVDTGIDASHRDLAGKVTAAANFTASNTTADEAGHGTHVAGIAAADFDNATGIAGMAPNARLINVKVLAVDDTGRTTGDCANVSDGIAWAADHGANVINLSLGSASPCEAMALAVGYAFSHGALVIAAAGNDGSTSRFYPAAYDHVLSVAATGPDDQIAGFSNRGAGWVGVAAPGADIVSTLPTYDNATGAVSYGYLSGTSMGAPLVSGIAALIWAELPADNRNVAVEQRILATAKRIPGTGTDWRWGRVDSCLAVTADAAQCSEPAPPPPPPVTSPPANPTPPPPPSDIAAPAPIRAARPVNAAPGRYMASVGRRGGVLLTVSGRGDALTRLDAIVLLRCQRGPDRRSRVTALSTTRYGRIQRGGRFRVRLKSRGALLRPQEIVLAGRFQAARRRAQGTLRVSGTASRYGRCDSGVIPWSARPATRS